MSDLVAGVDLGGTRIKVAVASAAGDVLCSETMATESGRGPDDVLQRIADLVGELSATTSGKLATVGVGVPGLVDISRGTTRFLPNLPTHWRDIAVAAKLSQTLSCRVGILNDARAATLAELRFGHGRDLPNCTLAFFALGTGVGGGVVVDGKLRLGPLGAAGELGHQTVLSAGPLCGCGNRGCLEVMASGPAIAAEGVRLMCSGQAPRLHELAEGNAAVVTTKLMAQVADSEPAVRGAIVRAAEFLGIAAANVVNVIHPELIVLGGGVAEIGSLLTDTVKATITDRVGMFPTDAIRVEPSVLGSRAGMLGAVALARDMLRGDLPSIAASST